MPITRSAVLILGGLLALGAMPVARAAEPTETADMKAPPSGDAAKGKQHFEAAGCGWCHANGGRTAGKGPKLEDTARSNSFIRFRVKHGKMGAMPAFGHTFNDAQINDIIAYIRSLKD